MRGRRVVASLKVDLFTIGESFAFVAGGANFLRQSYRICRLHPDRTSLCAPEDSAPPASAFPGTH